MAHVQLDDWRDTAQTKRTAKGAALKLLGCHGTFAKRGRCASFQERTVVPRYHFDWALGQHRVRDYDGVELADDAAAREHAVTEIRELLETTMGKRLGKDCKVEVCDANHHLLFSVDCKDA